MTTGGVPWSYVSRHIQVQKGADDIYNWQGFDPHCGAAHHWVAALGSARRRISHD
jgi:hypothetical protein